MNAEAMKQALIPGQPVPALFCEPQEREDWDSTLSIALSNSRRRVAEGRVGPDIDMEDFRQDLGQFDFQEPRPLADVIPGLFSKWSTELFK